MNQSNTSSAKRDIWEQTEWLFNIIFVFVVVISAFLDWLDDGLTPWAWACILGLLAVYAIGTWGLKREAGFHLPAFLFCLLLILFWFPLVREHYVYYFVLFGLYGQPYRFLSTGWGTAFALLISILASIAQIEVFSLQNIVSGGGLFTFVVMAIPGLLLGYWISAIISQSARRRELIEELEAAQASLAEAKRAEGILAERQRLAQDIHDTLAQDFTSIFMHLEAAEQALEGDNTMARGHLERARETAQHGLQQARQVVDDLRPQILAEHDLPEALRRVAERWSAATQIPVELHTSGRAFSTSTQIDVTLLRAVQEGLSNIHKHAQATQVNITLTYFEDSLALDIQDNGVGIRAAGDSRFGGGYGLQGMRERVASLQGDLTIESDAEMGTTLALCLPREAQEQSA